MINTQNKREEIKGDVPTRLFVASRHALLRAGCKGMLQQHLEASIEEFSDGNALDAAVAKRLPHAVVIDTDLDPEDGIQCTRGLIEKHSGLRVLLLSPQQDPWNAIRAFEAGALGFVWRYATSEVLAQAVRQVASGRHFLEKGFGEEVALLRISMAHDPFAGLSRREFEIFRLLASGSAVAEIARRLQLSQRSIANYQWLIRRKLNVSTNAELVHLALRHRVIHVEA